MARATEVLELTGDNLTVDDAERILRGRVERLTLAAEARRRVQQARRCVEDLLARGYVPLRVAGRASVFGMGASREDSWGESP